MNYYTCENCCNLYEKELACCPYCNTSKGKKDDGIIVFDDKARYEISTLGGMIFPPINLPSMVNCYIIPCEWGIIRFDFDKSVRWTYFCGLVENVEIQNYVQVINTRKIKYFLDIETGNEYTLHIKN